MGQACAWLLVQAKTSQPVTLAPMPAADAAFQYVLTCDMRFALRMEGSGMLQPDDWGVQDLRAVHALRTKQYMFAAQQYQSAGAGKQLALPAAQQCLLSSKLALLAAAPDSLCGPPPEVTDPGFEWSSPLSGMGAPAQVVH